VSTAGLLDLEGGTFRMGSEDPAAKSGRLPTVGLPSPTDRDPPQPSGPVPRRGPADIAVDDQSGAQVAVGRRLERAKREGTVEDVGRDDVLGLVSHC
jgi:hypothetical protein